MATSVEQPHEHSSRTGTFGRVGIFFILAAPLLRRLVSASYPYSRAAVIPVLLVCGIALVALQFRMYMLGMKASLTATDTLSRSRYYWRDKISATTHKPTAFEYFCTKYFHQDALLWSRLQLFYAIQVAISIALTTITQLSKALVLGLGVLFAGHVFLLYLEDDRFRCAARVAMEEAASDLKIPIVGAQKIYSHPTGTMWTLLVVLAIDVTFYVVVSSR